MYWDDRKTQEEILKVKDFLDIDRMPSNRWDIIKSFDLAFKEIS